MLLFQESGVMLVLVVKLDTLKGESNTASKLPYFCSKFVDTIKPEVRGHSTFLQRTYELTHSLSKITGTKTRKGRGGAIQQDETYRRSKT